MVQPAYPEAPRQDNTENLHGHRIHDPYRWLEDPGSPATTAWLAAQDELFRARMNGLTWRPGLRARISELRGCGEVSVPVWRGDQHFFTRQTAKQEHAVLYLADAEGTERVLIDPMTLDPSGLMTLDEWEPDTEGRQLAYQLSTGGTEESALYVMDVATLEIIDGPIDRCRYSPVAWLPSGDAFYYVRRLPSNQVQADEAQYHHRVYLHTVGSDARDDVHIFGDGMDKTTQYEVSVSPDGGWLVISAAQGTAAQNDLWLADLSASPPSIPALKALQEGVDAQTSAHVRRDGRVYLLTDRDAPRGRLCVADAWASDYGNWRELVPEDDEAVIDDYAILDGPDPASQVVLVVWARHAIAEITVHDLATGERVGRVGTPGLGSIGCIVERPEGGHEAWFDYTDNVTPPCVQRYDARTTRTTQWAAAPGVTQILPIETRQVSFTSEDGTTVRMLVLARPGGTGPRPTILNGYGGFGVSLTPVYKPSVIAWTEAGGVYAIANLRGGGEEGEEWHRAGILGNKQRVFDDFRAAAELLITDGWTTAEQLGIYGSSNGGLLVGAALTQHPRLFAAAVCSAPLLDMIRYHRSGLGATWAAEYGTADDPEQLGWLLSYSPYHHVHEGLEYPAVLFVVAGSDTRVDPLHARKMCAALQGATRGDGPILLRNETETGHGVRAASRTIELTVDMLSFLAEHTRLSARG